MAQLKCQFLRSLPHPLPSAGLGVFILYLQCLIYSVAQMIKNVPAVLKTSVRSLGQEDPLEKEMAIHSSILAWEIPWTVVRSGLPSMGLQELDTT